MNAQTIPCPQCATSIPFDTRALLEGAKFACPNCDAQISLSGDAANNAKNAYDQFETLKKKRDR